MAAQIDVTMTVVPPGAGSAQYKVSCDPAPYVNSDCLIDANMALHFFGKKRINLTLSKDYDFYRNAVCVAKPNLKCNVTHPTWHSARNDLDPKKATIDATQHFGDLEYTLYLNDPTNPSVPIPIDPMIHNGIKPGVYIFGATLLGLAVIGAFYFNRLRLRRTRGPIAPV